MKNTKNYEIEEHVEKVRNIFFQLKNNCRCLEQHDIDFVLAVMNSYLMGKVRQDDV